MTNQAEPYDFLKNIQEIYLKYIDKLLSSALIGRSRNTRKILRYYRKKIIEKDIHYISEKIIAYEVFGKGADYDPTVDSFVRVMFHRFRNTLQEYYLFEGESDLYELYFLKGSYVPRFRRRFIPRQVSSDIPFLLNKETLEDRIAGSLRTLFMISLSKEHLNLIIEYCKSVSEQYRSPYVTAIYYEVLILGQMIFRQKPEIDDDDLAKRVFLLHESYPDESHCYIPLILHLLTVRNYKECLRLSELLFEQASNPFYKGAACIVLAMITSKENLLMELQYISDISSHVSIFWKLPKIVYFLRNKDVEQAMHEISEASQNQNLLTRILQLVIKNKYTRLSSEDRQYVQENKELFSIDYLQNFIFELAREYAIVN